MQLKGLVRFFTILLIIYSLYQLSFTWFVRNHEKKMEARAREFVNQQYPTAAQKYPGNKDLQLAYDDTLSKIYEDRIKRLLDSTRDVTLTYGINGAMSYQKAKEEELNLGLDLQGGMNVTLEVEMTGLLISLSNNSKDPNFLQAIANAEKRKANSDADFITLFVQEYRKLEQTRPLASLFTAKSDGVVSLDDSDGKVEDYLHDQANTAFENTNRVLTTRIDKFGVAQPSINPNPAKQIITVELPGIKDKDRVRKFLQSTANLQFWEVYTLRDANYASGWQRTINAFDAKYGGKKDTTASRDTVKTGDTTNKGDTNKALAGGPDTSGKSLREQFGIDETAQTDGTGVDDLTPGQGNTIDKYIRFAAGGRDAQGNEYVPAYIGFVKDTARVNDILSEYRSNFPGDVRFAWGEQEKRGEGKGSYALYALRTFNRDNAPIEGDAITSARQDYNPQKGNQPIVTMRMNSTGASMWERLTEKSARESMPIAIVLDDIVYSAPVANERISGGSSEISGNFTVEEAQDLANLLEIGKLPAPAKIVQEQQVGPTLGKAAIKGGSLSFIISFVVIFLLMLVYYNTSGWIANIALILNLLFTVGILAGLGATLTAPGIAGLVLTIGMAVDTNVIIFERIKEELSRGKGYIPAINDGYRRSLPPVLDGHITTLLTAFILFYFGLGPVKGFATTQIIGLFLSLFCGILVSRWVTEWFTNKKRHLEYFTGISRKIFKHATYKFVEYRRITYMISIVVLVLGIASFINGFDQGVEFAGGRSYTVHFAKPVNVEEVRTTLKKTLEGDNPIIKTIGGSSTLDITTAYLINETSPATDSVVRSSLFAGLRGFLPEGIAYDQFADGNGPAKSGIQGSKKILPTISDDLRSGAVKATIFAMIVIFLYIFIRFRDWRYSLGTIVALLHDVLVTLIVFSFARNIVPFPLEIDQHFIAAILTVIGFSMNDTVIVFDRIREDTKLMPNAPRGEVINRAINETLSRTIMTSLTVFLTILILFIVGGEVTRGFAFAMLIGVITGIYSSVFVAAPILVDLESKKKRVVKEKEKSVTVMTAKS